MNNYLYIKLAINSIKKQIKFYMPYLFINIAIIVVYLSVYSISSQLDVDGFTLSRVNRAARILPISTQIVGFFSVIIIFYVNSFLLKYKKKELGLYIVLGMEKKNITRTMLFEHMILFLISIIFGFFLAVVLNGLLFMILLRLMRLPISLYFFISINSLVNAFIFFFIIFFVTLIFNVINIKMLKPIELLKSENIGEKESNYLALKCVISIIFLFIGYYILTSNLTVSLIEDAILILFVSTIFVIVGTYGVFTYFSMILFKILKKSKKIYYKSSNFISISTMNYRIRRNSIGMANISILITAIIIVLSTTLALYISIEKTVHEISTIDSDFLIRFSIPSEGRSGGSMNTDYGEVYFRDYLEEALGFNLDDTTDIIESELNIYFQEYNLYVTNFMSYYSGPGFMFISTEFFNETWGRNIILNDDEILYLYNSSDGGTNYLFDINSPSSDFFNIGEIIKLEELNYINFENVTEFNYFIVANQNLIDDIVNNIYELDYLDKLLLYYPKPSIYEFKGGTHIKPLSYPYQFPHQHIIIFDASGSLIDDFNRSLSDLIDSFNVDGYGWVELGGLYVTRASLYSVNGSLLFLGLFLGILFTLCTFLIIYYKKMLEAYEDVKIFKNMQKVGLSEKNIKNIIKRQAFVMFFVPFFMAVINFIFYFNILSLTLGYVSLGSFSFYYNNIFMLSSFIVIFLFMILYIGFNVFTNKVYYKMLIE